MTAEFLGVSRAAPCTSQRVASRLEMVKAQHCIIQEPAAASSLRPSLRCVSSKDSIDAECVLNAKVESRRNEPEGKHKAELSLCQYIVSDVEHLVFCMLYDAAKQ